MFNFIKAWVLRVFVMGLISDERFLSFVKNLIVDYYKNETLHVYRVWGDSSKIHLGDGVHLNNAILNTVSGSISIGDETFFGHSVSVLTGTHDISKKGMSRQAGVPCEGRDVVIGKGVWIASNSIILGPCVIGDNSVIGAGSLVTGDVSENSFYAGCPAVKIKNLVADEIS